MRKRKEALGKEGVYDYLMEPIQINRTGTEKVCIFQRLDEEQ